MFSLTISIVSIALVAALVAATLYYGGTAFREGNAKAQVVKLLNQGQQLTAAAELYKTKNGEYPQVLEDLVTEGYLQMIPTAQAPTGVSVALAAQTEWRMLPNTPVFVLDGLNVSTCRAVNLAANGVDGVLDTVITAWDSQCYSAEAGTFSMVASKDQQHIPRVLNNSATALAAAPVDATDPRWVVRPFTVSLSPGELKYPETRPGETSVLSVVARNMGRNSVNLQQPAAVEGSSDFSVTVNTCPSVLQVGDECTVTVAYTPASTEQTGGALALFGPADTVLGRVTLTGTPMAGTAQFEDLAGVLLEELAFEPTLVGRTRELSFRVANTAANELRLYSPFLDVPAPFYLVDSDCDSAVLDPTGYCTVVLGFAPEVVGAYAAANHKAVLSGGLKSETALPLSGEARMEYLQVAVSGGGASASVFLQRADKTWWAEGANSSGQLGLGTTSTTQPLTRVTGLDGAVRVLAEGKTAFAQMSDGTWRAVGDNYRGRLGLVTADGSPDTVSRSVFTPLPASVEDVVVGTSVIFMKHSGGVWKAYASYAPYGELGLGTLTGTTGYVAVPELQDASQVLVGEGFSFAKLTNGTWAATGNNGNGQLGLGDYTNRRIFTHVPDLDQAEVAVTTGGRGGLAWARFADGSWKNTGWATPAGRGTTGRVNVFTPVPGIYGATEVQSLGTVSFARLASGEWASTGQADYGEARTGSRTLSTEWTIVLPADVTQVMRVMCRTLARGGDGIWRQSGTATCSTSGLTTVFVPASF